MTQIPKDKSQSTTYVLEIAWTRPVIVDGRKMPRHVGPFPTREDARAYGTRLDAYCAWNIVPLMDPQAFEKPSPIELGKVQPLQYTPPTFLAQLRDYRTPWGDVYSCVDVELGQYAMPYKGMRPPSLSIVAVGGDRIATLSVNLAEYELMPGPGEILVRDDEPYTTMVKYLVKARVLEYVGGRFAYGPYQDSHARRVTLA